ncbi:hypothetical protein CEXT_538751 [Caerostris extrusa]|uniref:Uncharacterized protein n=1 Tax=Caerostris extrusa TaxID=172846 RepID=A0AAV4QSK0_CAEEX|nr:hypothetical protein CEXT_538751 [Caerostris extrusa]
MKASSNDIAFWGKGFWTCHDFALSKSSSKAVWEGLVELFRLHGRAQMNVIEDSGFNMCHWKCAYYWSVARIGSVSLINVRGNYLLQCVSNIRLRYKYESMGQSQLDTVSGIEERMIFEDSVSLHILCEYGSKLGRVRSSNLSDVSASIPKDTLPSNFKTLRPPRAGIFPLSVAPEAVSGAEYYIGHRG